MMIRKLNSAESTSCSSSSSFLLLEDKSLEKVLQKTFTGMGDPCDESKGPPEEEPLRVKRREEFDLEVPTAVDRCGIGCFSPGFMQRFATRQAFMMVFSILAIVQGMSWSYFTATITTLEKRFKISSQTAGIVMTGNEISQVLFSILIAYYGSRGHRPHWIAVGVLFSAMSCFVLASPHLFYGAGEDALSLTEGYGNQDALLSTSSPSPASIKSESGRRNRIQLCEVGREVPLDPCGVGELSIVPLVLIFVSQFVAGIGVLLFFSLGGPYLDDNVEKKQSPMLFGVTMSLRLIGPLLGFLLASACLKLFISPGLRPIISSDDPRWMGAWWLGWVILGVMMMVTSLFIAMFPRELPEAMERRRKAKLDAGAGRRGSHGVLSFPETPADFAKVGSQIIFPSENSADNPLPKLSEMSTALKALLKNKVNLFNNLSSVFYLFSVIGYWTYMPKYMETIFMQTAVSASAISGTVSIAFQATGLILSGALISRFQPSARKLAAWNVCIGILYVLVKIIFTQLGCDPGKIAHGETEEGGAWNLSTSCNAPCNCKVNKMLPVCYNDGNEVFYSACHAGCASFTNKTGSDCSCLPSPQDTVTLGTCSEGCYKIFLVFLAVNAVIKFLDSSGRIGNMLVSYRCVDPKEKSLAIGLGIFLISIFAMLPAPIFFGAIYDRSCLVWGTKCGAKGNCWLYDGQTLRYAFNLSAACFTFVGMLFDVLVWYYVKDLDLYDEDKNVLNRKLKSDSKSPQNIT